MVVVFVLGGATADGGSIGTRSTANISDSAV